MGAENSRVAVMERINPDGSREIYCERPSRAPLSRDYCIECCSPEECLDIYGLDAIRAYRTGTREYRMVQGQLMSMPITRDSHNTSLRTTTRTTTNTRRDTTNNVTHNTNSGVVITGNNNNINIHNNASHSQPSGNISATSRPPRGRPASAPVHQSIGMDSEQLAIYESLRSAPRHSGFSPAEQEAWEARHWEALQLEELESAPTRATFESPPRPTYVGSDDRCHHRCCSGRHVHFVTHADAPAQRVMGRFSGERHG
ncbi:uncharacterized protein CTRU02_207781 [Colletotrichum truncatum]|uniref:Uncharacterized protein n=1 Tax=Colletotrichum truncatum TaxID=5467 RepID=A0ACC3Z1W3_COLTU|nr:uncharacterized protein CTRU02_09119 [Colletotrichum truncatum]KAF6788798.1 hypothetical protein CTRU02_09119 [Colletotrichum truncatum]